MSSLDDIFVLFDLEGENRIAKADVGKVMRCMKLVPDNAEIDALVTEFVKGDKATKDDVERCVQKFMGSNLHNNLSAEEVMKSLAIYDQSGTRKIPFKDFMSDMGSQAFGEPFEEAEIKRILALIGNPEGQDISIETIVNFFYAEKTK
eukprot:c10016_g1_i1.p2 GENE.c10016_g1_i1~~c10016_g1_i1.p2  ORF type:complete len:148 (-),score=46.73 c10016_g1_i1:36-479(-)